MIRSKSITDILYILNTSKYFKGKDITLTTLEEYNKKYNRMSKRYTITIWTRKKRKRTDKDVQNKFDNIIQNIPNQHVFYNQTDVLLFLSDLFNELES